MAHEERVRRTQRLAATLPVSAPWADWLAASGEACPDFSHLAARTGLWPPSQGLSDPAEWPARRTVIKARWRRWVIGSMPERPDSLDVVVLRHVERGGVSDRTFELRMPAGAARLRMRLLVPSGPPAPVLLSQTGHESWGRAALERGWAACLVSACDGDDDTDSLVAAYPDYDWSRLARRAWALGRALDALERDRAVDATRVVLTGHSRNGKAALIAAAHDERFAGIVSSSAGVMGAIPARLCCDRHSGEGIELLTRVYPDWYHPRLRFFSGREQRLPTDAHELLALVAPRPLLLSVAVNDPVESTWAAERTEESVRGVYGLLGAPESLALRWRSGGHRLEPAAFERHLDWCDAAIGRTSSPPGPARRLHPHGWAPWARPVAGASAPRVTIDPVTLRRELTTWLAVPTGPPPRPPSADTIRPERRGGARQRPEVEPPSGIALLRTRTSDGVDLHVYLPAVRATTGPLPLTLWLAPLCRAAGYVAGYDQGVPLLESLARRGWAVACHDPLGTGSRLGQEAEVGQGPSPLARMVHDASQVLRAAQALEPVGAGPAWIASYGAGALVGLHLAALDPNVAGGAFVAPLSGDPLLPERPPRHGLADLLGAFGPRRGLVLIPRWDPEGARGHLAAAARAAASSGASIEHRTVADYHRLSAETRALVAAWLDEAARGVSRAAA